MADRGFGDGPYHLSPRAVDSIVTRNGPGTFVLGETTDSGFHIELVGSSDTDVNARLHAHVGKYRHFRFDYLPSGKDAYRQECQLYHDYHPQDNKGHPEPPPGEGWGCPFCGFGD